MCDIILFFKWFFFHHRVFKSPMNPTISVHSTRCVDTFKSDIKTNFNLKFSEFFFFSYIVSSSKVYIYI